MREIKVGIIGVQGYGSTYFETIGNIPYAKIQAICDLNREVADSLAKKYDVSFVTSDYKELLKREDIDVVFISTPHFLHYPMTMEALAAGKHVFCEKPLATCTEHAVEMAETARQKGLVLSCHYNRRQTVMIKAIQDFIQRDLLGTIYHANIKWMSRYTSFMFDENSSWRTSKEKAGGGILIGRGSHMMDAVWFLMGRPVIKSVYAHTSSALTGLEVEDYAMVILKLENGCVIHLEFSYEANLPNYSEKLEYELLGSKAGISCVEMDGVSTMKAGYCQFPEQTWVSLDDCFRMDEYSIQQPATIIEDFIEAVAQKKEPYVTGEDGAFITRLLTAAYQSAETGKEVYL